MITKNVMKLNEFSNSIWYKTSCACGANEHDCTIVIESDNERPLDVYMTFYKTLSWADYGYKSNFFTEKINRIKCALKVLFKGYIELEDSFLFNDEEHIDNFIKAIQEGKDKINED